LRCCRNQYNDGGASNLQANVRQRIPELVADNEQIRLLKNIVARQQMELKFKDELF
jgi:putative transposase